MQATDPVAQYGISFADLVEIADAAVDMNGYTCLLVDHPDDIAYIQARVERLHDLVQRAMGDEAWRIYGKDDLP